MAASKAAGSLAPSVLARSEGVEALQLELACRAYMHEPDQPNARQLANADLRKARGADARDDQRVLEAILDQVKQ